MTEKEIREIKRRFNPDKSNISYIKGCLVTESKSIAAVFSQSIALSGAEETENLLAIMKKTLSGAYGANLLDIQFDTDDVVSGKEHGLLMRLKKSALSDEEALNEFYVQAAETIRIDGSYAILLVCDKYDVFNRAADGTRDEDSSSTYTYIVCAVCPLKLTKPALSFHASDNAFHNLAASSVISPPEFGFLFPAFDARRENIYNALYYTHSINADSTDFVNRIFKAPLPMPAAAQKEVFDACIAETVGDEYDFEVVKAVREQVSELIEEHKNSKDDEPLVMTKETIKDVLVAGGVTEEKAHAFGEKYEKEFGSDAKIPPENLINTKKLELTLPEISIKVNPERSDLITTQIINGTKYILINASEGVEVNGVNISIN